MGDKEYIQSIKRMNIWSLCSLIIEHPDYLNDSYFFDFGVAIRVRFHELEEERQT